MTADTFIRDRLRGAVDSERFELDRLLLEITAASMIDVERVPPPPRRRWPVAAGALAATAAAVALAFWAITSGGKEAEPVHTPTPRPTGTAIPATDLPAVGRLVFVTTVDSSGRNAVDGMRPGDSTPSNLQLEQGVRSVTGSPDGRFIAFTEAVGGGSREVVVSGAGSNGRVRIVTRFGNLQNVAWAPDGDRFAFTTDHGELYEIGVDGSGLRRVAVPSSGCGIENVSWSPSGKELSWWQACAGGGPSGIYVQDLGTGDARRVVDINAVLGLSWSPDGTRIAYGALSSFGRDIWVVDRRRGGRPISRPITSRRSRRRGRPMGSGSASSATTASRSCGRTARTRRWFPARTTSPRLPSRGCRTRSAPRPQCSRRRRARMSRRWCRSRPA